MVPVLAWSGGRERRLEGSRSPLSLDELVPGSGPWEVEIGFGKGRYLLRRAAEDPSRRFLGIEIAGEYYRLAAARAAKRRLFNLALFRGEALYLLCAVLPPAFADVVHVYFPDPWPKTRHQKRRLFDPETIDLVLGLLRPGGTLCFATDFLAYGELVGEILASYPGLELNRLPSGWPEGPRTNYEAKYIEEGRPILRLTAGRTSAEPRAELHPHGEPGVAVAYAPALAGDRHDNSSPSGIA